MKRHVLLRLRELLWCENTMFLQNSPNLFLVAERLIFCSTCSMKLLIWLLFRNAFLNWEHSDQLRLQVRHLLLISTSLHLTYTQQQTNKSTSWNALCLAEYFVIQIFENQYKPKQIKSDMPFLISEIFFYAKVKSKRQKSSLQPVVYNLFWYWRY